jgi:hypothetical protein
MIRQLPSRLLNSATPTGDVKPKQLVEQTMKNVFTTTMSQPGRLYVNNDKGMVFNHALLALTTTP